MSAAVLEYSQQHIVIDTESKRRCISAAQVTPAMRRAIAPESAAPINCLELLAILCALITYRDIIRGKEVWLFVENTAAISATVHGYTSFPFLGPLSNAVQFALAPLGCDLRIEYVPTDAKPADVGPADRDRNSLNGVVLRVTKVIQDAQNPRVQLKVCDDGDSVYKVEIPIDEVRVVKSKQWNQALEHMLEFFEALFAESRH